ncbi:hypothetical protein V8E51_011795 [Hyaloscypha variabilis]|jgi:hypothetical protein
MGLLSKHPQNEDRVTFKEFWEGHESGGLVKLMESKGLKPEPKVFPSLEKFLSVSPSAPQPSVWSLKQFLAISEPAMYPPIPAVSIDCGFMNCETFEETCVLRELLGGEIV